VYADETLTCVACKRPFTFTVSEQEFYASKNFTNKPGRCSDCRDAGRATNGGHRGSFLREGRELFKATCTQCGGGAEVPFQPQNGRPVYCRNCYSLQPAYRSKNHSY
jgi:CxxC-x17-CxxC domain-containing protein